jgi:hypothetical protein
VTDFEPPITPEESTEALRLAAGLLVARITGDFDGFAELLKGSGQRHLAFGMTMVAVSATNLAAHALNQPVEEVARFIALQLGTVTEDDV